MKLLLSSWLNPLELEEPEPNDCVAPILALEEETEPKLYPGLGAEYVEPTAGAR